MTDLFGPSTEHGGVTVRPGETRPIEATDTFFKDCTSPEADDGTELPAAYFNAFLAYMRKLARANGNTGGGAAIVPEDNGDDDIILKAVQHLIQRGQQTYAADTGTANAIIASLSPALAEYKTGGKTIWIKKAAFANTSGAVTVNLNGLGDKDIVRFDGTALEAGDLPSGCHIGIVYDGTKFRKVSPDRDASQAEVDAGILSNVFVSPSTLFARRQPYFLATGSTPQAIADGGSEKKITNLDALASSYFNTGSSYAGDTFTCGAKDAGAWLFLGYAAYEILTAPTGSGIRMYIARNSVTGPFESKPVSAIGTYGCNVFLPLVLSAGQTVDLRTFHSTGASRNIVSTQFFGMRLSND